MVEDIPNSKPSAEQTNNRKPDEAQVKSERTNSDEFMINNVESDSFLEQSFEIISSTLSTIDDNNYSTEIINKMNEGPENTNEQRPGEDGNSTTNGKKPRSNSENPAQANTERRRKSGSFLSKLQSSFSDNHDQSSPPVASNISSSIVGAFSSFTSNFTLNQTSDKLSASSSTIETASASTTTTSTKLQQIQETKEDIFIKKAALERKNLISLTKLIVKDLLSTSLSNVRTINNEDCQNLVHLTNYFTLIDRVLKHGLKLNILTNRSASLWNALDSLPKYLKESTLISESVRSLANTKTADGKIKAWIRLVMMQKKMPEYFNELLVNKNSLLKDVYHDHAFMMNDEAHVFAGLIIGVNVIDCNFFVKDANFDLMDDIIDLSPYLRLANSYDGDYENFNYPSSGVGGDTDSSFLMNGLSRSASTVDVERVQAVLDQKNYLEEWNKKLESTIADLRGKIKLLEEQNSKLEMESKLTEARLAKLFGSGSADHQTLEKSNLSSNSSSSITHALKNFMGTTSEITQTIPGGKAAVESASMNSCAIEDDKGEKEKDCIGKVSTDSNDKQKKLVEFDEDGSINDEDQESPKEISQLDGSSNETAASEAAEAKFVELKRKFAKQSEQLNNVKDRANLLESSYRGALEKIKTLEHDLDVQTSMNADKETTIKIYEKDIREKQAQVESLRASLNDAKKLNSDLTERLSDTSNKLKDRIKMVSTLQASLDRWKLENKTISSRLQDRQISLKKMTSEFEELQKTINDLKEYNKRINEELRTERENGQSSNVTVETQNVKINNLVEKLEKLEVELKDVKPYRDQVEELNQRCKDYELSLEEIGAQLRESRLEVENLRENSAVYLDSQWMDSKAVKNCALCQQLFSVTRRKHHCRLCGNVFCQTCSDNKMELASSKKPVRVCDTCHSFLLAKFVKSANA